MIQTDELPKSMPHHKGENDEAYKIAHMAKKIDEIVKWINKQEDKMATMRKALKLAGQFEESEQVLDTALHPIHEQHEQK